MKREDKFIFSIFGLERTVEEENGNSRERKSNFSLDFPVFRPSVLFGPRSKLSCSTRQGLRVGTSFVEF